MKKETLEKAAENYGWRIKRNTFSDAVKANELAESAKQDFIEGAKYQAERMYSEDDLVRFMQFIISQESLQNTSSVSETTAMYYIEQFKKK